MIRFIVLAVLILGPLHILNAQLPETGPEKEASFSEKTKRRPKVGLVLSGGAAKGMAHVGVLKILEEAGLQPDIITGTSMGSIIGGLYAIGYRADTLEQLLIGQDWDRLLSDRIPLQNVIFEEKDFFENQLIELPYEEGKIQTPGGLIYGQQISALLSRLALPAYPFEDFSLLPIPYHCVAADIIRGEHVVLKEGYLPRAMRASMAIPTIFTPVVMDSMILIDGGLVRNFPVQEALDMGADILIGVYTGYLRAEREELQSFSSILRQSTFLLSVRDAEEQLPLLDVYINPDLGRYGPQDFKSADSIIVRGGNSARAFLPRLKKLADSLDAIGPGREIPTLAPVTEICPDTIWVDGNDRFSAQEIKGRFGVEAGETISISQLENAINLLFGTNYFEKVSYRLRQEGNETILVLDVVEKAPTQLKAAINYDNYLGAGFLFNASSRNIFLPASRLSFTGTISDKYRFNLNYLKYVDEPQRSSFLGTLELTRDEIPIFQDGLQNQAFRILEFLADFRLQRRLGKNNMIGLGVQREHLFFKPLVGSQPLFRRLDYINYNAYAFWEMNTLDRNILPTRGLRLSFEYKGINNSNFDVSGLSPESPVSEDSLFSFNPYSKLSLHAKGYIPLHRRASVAVRPFVGLVLNPSNTFGDFYLVGAPEMLTRRSIPFYGLNANQMVAQVAVGMGLGYQHFLRDNLMFSVDANAGFFAQPDGLATAFPEPEQFMAGFGLTAGYNSFLGPVKFTLMYPIDTDNTIPRNLRFFLTLGHRF